MLSSFNNKSRENTKQENIMTSLYQPKQTEQNIIKLSEKMKAYKIQYPLPEKLLIYRDAMLFTLSQLPVKVPQETYNRKDDIRGTNFSIWSPYLLEDMILLNKSLMYVNMFRLTSNITAYTNEESIYYDYVGDNKTTINFKATGLIIQETKNTPKHASIFISYPKNYAVEYVGSYLISPTDIEYKYNLTDLNMKKQTLITDD